MDFGLIVDFETTGMNPQQDRIMEIGLVGFAVGEDRVPRIVEMYSGVEDPGCPISPEVAAITGIDANLAAGRQIHWEYVRSLWARASVIIAHNAEFDRAFAKQRPELADLDVHWACSMRHIDWEGRGFSSLKLSYLAADQGFLNPFPHRALFDCATTFRLIAPHLDELVTRSYEREIVIKAVGSPFESKDKLRTRRYRWDPDQRYWYKVVSESKLAEERTFLAAEIYGGRARHVEEEVTLPT